ncbi:MAG: hypothetical protein QOE45_1519 [Frankiaceae bacterium]|jgi:predicted GNAT superfamily acetyltransferase|nr:hypothetical protein [Frankiaceae bacterium]
MPGWVPTRQAAGVTLTSPLSDAVSEPDTTAASACAEADVRIQPLGTLEAVRDATALFSQVWGSDVNAPPLAVEVMRAIEHAGGYAIGAYSADQLVAASAGFLGCDAFHRPTLHSHISGVLPRAQGRGIGRAIKLYQRAWALARGIETVTWTFDPLVRRNAWFSLSTLGAQGVDYLVDFNGPMDDGRNAGQAGDQLFARWNLRESHVVAAALGRPAIGRPEDGRLVLDDRDGFPWPVTAVIPDDERPLLIRLPVDVERLRVDRPEAARRWRMALRDVMVPAFAADRRTTAMTRDGCLVLQARPSAERSPGAPGIPQSIRGER